MRRREELNDDSIPSDLCVFCYLPESRPVLFETDDVYAIPSLGHFVEGYLLLNHQNHVDCFGEAATADIREVKDTVRAVLEDEYGSCVFFEHGRVGSCFTRGNERLCHHAHIHCLPVSKDFFELIAADFDTINIDSWTEIREVCDHHQHYLYYESPSAEKFVFPINKNLERQYLRKRACEALDLPIEWADWREYPMRDRMYRTSQTLKGKFELEV